MARILFLHVVAMIVTAMVIPLILYLLLEQDAENLQRGAMQGQAEQLARHLVARPQGEWTLDLPTGLRDQYSEAYGRYAYAVIDPAGKVLFSSRKDGSPIFSMAEHPSETRFMETRRGDRILFGIILRKDTEGRPVYVQVAEDLSHRDVLIDDIVTNFFPQVAWITVPILLLLLATDIVIFRRAVEPLLLASSRAEHINPSRLDVRLPTEDIPTEIRPLVIAVNQALDRLEQGFARQRTFAADAAHELRTPLAILRSRIETLSDKAEAQALHRDIESMSRIVSQLLDAADLETVLITRDERADLQAICSEVAEFIAPLVIEHGKTLSLSGTDRPVWVNGNAEMLRRAVRNLVENALYHAPKGTKIEIVVTDQGSISVQDEGEGVPIAKRELIFQRLWRRDRRQGGAGLGLSSVKRIVDAHGGSVTAENRPSGGANFLMRFPVVNPFSDTAGSNSAKDM